MSTARTKLIAATSVITRPADTTTYADKDLVANSGTAGSVTPFVFANVTRGQGYRSRILRAGLLISAALITNGTFRLHLFTTAPTVTAGDNSGLDIASGLSSYLGFQEIVLGILGTGQGAFGWGSSNLGNSSGPMNFQASTTSTSLWALLEAKAAFVPTSAMTLAASLEVDQY